MHSAWKVLSLPHVGDSIPPLIIKYEIGTSDYTVWITDLTLIWRESLDRKRIIRRSLDVDTSIDPSEDSDQLRLFLQRLGEALEQQPGTTLDLVQNNSHRSLLLRTFTPLPGSLKPLEWPIELLPASQSTLTAQLVVPMLSQQVIANAEKASLLQQLKEKDQVIAKLTDKMHSDGVDLGRLFPGIASKSSKSMSRQALGKSVKGFGEFNEHRWRNNLINNVASSKPFVELISDTFDIDLGDHPEFAPMPDYKNWCERLRRRESQPMEPVSVLHHNDAEEGFAQDEFQRQLIHDKQRIASHFHDVKEKNSESENVKVRARKQPKDNGDSTTDESDQDLHPTKPNPTSFNKKSVDRDGILSSARESSRMSSPTDSDKQANNEFHQKQMSFRGASTSTDRASNSDGGVSPAVSRAVKGNESDQNPAVLKPRAKLGKIGGKGKAGKGDESQPYTSHATPAVGVKYSHSVLSPSTTKVGAISKVSAETERSGRASIEQQAPSPPRETSQERADRNRENLKRELESKSQTGAKKKRRF